MEYAALIEARVARPFSLASTRVTITPDMRARLAMGHLHYLLLPQPGWDFDVLAGAGALHSSANDLMTLVAAAMGVASTPLSPAIEAALAARVPTGELGVASAFGWYVVTANRCDRSGRCSPMGLEFIEHAGSSYGYRSYVGFHPKARIGVVVLSNAGNTAGSGDIADIGRHLLSSQMPLRPDEALRPARERSQTKVEPAVLDRYVGRYGTSRNPIIVTHDRGRLLIGDEGDLKIEVFPESDREFFYKAMDAQVTFSVNDTGRATELVFRGSGPPQRSKRLE
jgi:CubicO group peptidase (beta-lactamase class C family)